MGWLSWIVLIIIGIFFIGYCSFKMVEDFEHPGVLIVWIPISLVVTVMCFGLFFLISGEDVSGRYKRVEFGSTYTEIYSVGLHDNTKGSFSLGCGIVETKPVYYYYKKHNGGYMLDRVNAEQCTIVETDNMKPSIKHVRYRKEGETDWYRKAVFGNNEEFWRSCIDNESKAEYIIYIPVGSIMQNYNVSL